MEPSLSKKEVPSFLLQKSVHFPPANKEDAEKGQDYRLDLFQYFECHLLLLLPDLSLHHIVPDLL